MIKRYKTSIAFRLFLIVFVLSIMLTLAITLLETFIDYKDITPSVKEEIEEIQKRNSASIAESLWVMESHKIQVHLEGILNYPHLEHLKIQKGTRIIVSAGAIKSKYLIQQEYPLYHTYDNKQIYLGTLSITAGLDGAYNNLLKSILRRLFYKGIIVFSISLFILFIVHIIVTKHLSAIAHYVTKLNPLQARGPLVLHERLFHKTQDELDNVVTAINVMDKELRNFFRETNLEITEVKKAEEALREASLYTRSLIEVSLDPLVTISKDGKISDVNDATVSATGVSREELIGSDFSNYFTEPEKAREGYLQVFEKGFVKDYPLAIRHISGSITEVLYNASVYKDIEGNVTGIFAAARDVTERKRAEAEREKLINELKDALANVKTLSGMLPICATCKKIRDDKGYWSQVETYVSEHTEAVFTSGICPDCEKKAYAEFEKLKNENT